MSWKSVSHMVKGVSSGLTGSNSVDFRTEQAIELELKIKVLEREFLQFSAELLKMRLFCVENPSQTTEAALLDAEMTYIELEQNLKNTKELEEKANLDIMVSRARCPDCGQYKVFSSATRSGGYVIGEVVADDCCKQRAQRVVDQAENYIKWHERQDAIARQKFESGKSERAAVKGLTLEQRAEIMNAKYNINPHEYQTVAEQSTIAQRLKIRLTKNQIPDAQELQYVA